MGSSAETTKSQRDPGIRRISTFILVERVCSLLSGKEESYERSSSLKVYQGISTIKVKSDPPIEFISSLKTQVPDPKSILSKSLSNNHILYHNKFTIERI